jgi:predicted lipoprotein with Yx(FWY)xxD motif
LKCVAAKVGCCAQCASLCKEIIMNIAMKCLGLAAILTLAGSISASAEDYGPFKVADSASGKILVDANGMTLYTYDQDAAGKSNCSGECAEYWPPAKAMDSDKPVGDLTIIKRDDGSMQWADDGKPLYTFVKDKKAGDVMGDNMKNVWHLVKENN